MNTTKVKIVNKRWLEKQIKELNDWLSNNTAKCREKWEKEHRRNYYVHKLIEMEENNYKLIDL